MAKHVNYKALRHLGGSLRQLLGETLLLQVMVIACPGEVVPDATIREKPFLFYNDLFVEVFQMRKVRGVKLSSHYY